MLTVRLLANYPLQGLLRFSPSGTDVVDGVRFILEGEGTSDVVILLNDVATDTTVRCREGAVLKVLQEPAVPLEDGGFAFAWTHRPEVTRVLTHHLTGDARERHCPPLLGWSTAYDYASLKAMPVPKKTHAMSAIASAQKYWPGHARRRAFIDGLRPVRPQISFFGRGTDQPLDDKWAGLAAFRTSIAIENSVSPGYWTEKLFDCFLSFTVPLYHGDPNVAATFPQESMLSLPIRDEEAALSVIDLAFEPSLWDERLEALVDARHTYLTEWNPLRVLAREARCALEELAGARTRTVRLRAPRRPLRKRARRASHRAIGTLRRTATRIVRR
jgi:hypothetical protein